ETNGNQSFYFSSVDGLKKLIGGQAFPGHVLFIYSPDFSDIFTVFRIGNVPVAWELIAFVTVFSAALTVALSGDGAIAAVGFPDPSGGQYQIDTTQYIVYSLGMVF